MIAELTHIPEAVKERPDAADVPREGEESGLQSSLGAWAGAYGFDCRNGGTDSNPCGFPRYTSLYAGSYLTYDWMLEHPIIQQVRAQVHDPIIAAPWGYEARKGTSAKRIDFVREQMECLRIQLLEDALRAMDYGWAPFEKVWDIRGGKYRLVNLKPLAVGETSILHYRGDFAGLRFGGERDLAKVNDSDWLRPNKSWLYTYDRKFGNLYGRSRLENMRATAWRDWLDAATDLFNLSQKISGIMPIMYTPPGSFKTSDGTSVTWAANAKTALQAAKKGLGLHLTHLGGQTPGAGVQNFDQLMQLIKVSAVRLEVIDFGSNAPAIGSILDRMKHDEELMFAGYFQSPRTGMATTGGTKADAEQHTDTATINSENVAASIARSLNQNVVDQILELNFGPAAKGSVWINPGKLTDANLATDKMILAAVFANTDGLGTQYLEQIDIDAITDRRGIPKRDGAEIELESVPTDENDDTLPGDNADGEEEDKADADKSSGQGD